MLSSWIPQLITLSPSSSRRKQQVGLRPLAAFESLEDRILLTSPTDVTARKDGAKISNTQSPNRARGSMLFNDTAKTGGRLKLTAVTGSADKVDVVAGTATRVAGEFGTLIFHESGRYVYQVKKNLAAVKNLAGGSKLVDTFTYESANTGHTGTSTLRVIITTDAADATAPPLASWSRGPGLKARKDGGEVSADADPNRLRGELLKNDTAKTGDKLEIKTIIGANSTGAAGEIIQGKYGTLKVKANGSFVYQVKQNLEAVKQLKAGEKLIETFAYVANNNKGTVASVLKIRIVGVNDPPVTKADIGAVNQGSTLLVNVLANDKDPESDVLKISTFDATSVSGATITPNGNDLDYDASTGAAILALGVGETLEDTFTYTIDDGNGNGHTATATVTITVTGIV